MGTGIGGVTEQAGRLGWPAAVTRGRELGWTEVSVVAVAVCSGGRLVW